MNGLQSFKYSKIANSIKISNSLNEIIKYSFGPLSKDVLIILPGKQLISNFSLEILKSINISNSFGNMLIKAADIIDSLYGKDLNYLGDGCTFFLIYLNSLISNCHLYMKNNADKMHYLSYFNYIFKELIPHHVYPQIHKESKIVKKFLRIDSFPQHTISRGDIFSFIYNIISRYS